MKLSRAKIARLLKTGNQSRKNKKNRERRSKSLHIANNSTSIFKDDELILLPTPTANMQSIMTASKANRRARSANNKRKTLNLRFKTMKHRKQKGKQSGGGGMQSDSSMEGGALKLIKVELTDDEQKLLTIFKQDIETIKENGKYVYQVSTDNNKNVNAIFTKYTSLLLKFNIKTADELLTALNDSENGLLKDPPQTTVQGSDEDIAGEVEITKFGPENEPEEDRNKREEEERKAAEEERKAALPIESGEDTTTTGTGTQSDTTLTITQGNSKQRIAVTKADEPPAVPSTLNITIVSKETDTLELVEGVTAANKPTPKNTEKPLEPQLTVDSTIEDLLKAIAALQAFQGVDDSPSRPWYKPDTDQIFYNNETDDIGKHTSTEKLGVTFKAAKPDDVISLRIVAKTIKITVLGPDGKKTTVSDKDFKVDDPLNTIITGISGLKSCIDIDLITGKKNDAGVAFDANKHAVTDQNGNILILAKSFKDNDIESDATLTIRTNVYIFFQRLLYGDLYFYVDVQYIRNVFNYLTSEPKEYGDLIKLQPFPADTKSEEEQEKLEQNKKLWADAAKETRGGALELEGGAKKGAEDGSNAVDTSAGGSEAEQIGGEIVQTGGAWQTGGAFKHEVERDEDTKYVGFPVPELTPKNVKTDYNKFILALIGADTENTIFPELYFGEGRGKSGATVEGYNKRMIELGKKIAPVISDIEKLQKLQEKYDELYKIASDNSQVYIRLKSYNENLQKKYQELEKELEESKKLTESTGANAIEKTNKLLENRKKIEILQQDLIKIQGERQEVINQNQALLLENVALSQLTEQQTTDIKKLDGDLTLLTEGFNILQEKNKGLKEENEALTDIGNADVVPTDTSSTDVNLSDESKANEFGGGGDIEKAIKAIKNKLKKSNANLDPDVIEIYYKDEYMNNNFKDNDLVDALKKALKKDAQIYNREDKIYYKPDELKEKITKTNAPSFYTNVFSKVLTEAKPVLTGVNYEDGQKHIAALEEARGYWREFITGAGPKVFTKEEPTEDLVQKLKMKYYLNFIAYIYLDAQKVSEMAGMLENKNILKKINAYFQDIDALSFTDSFGNKPPEGAVSKFFASLRVNYRINEVSQSAVNNLEENKQHMAGLVEVYSKNHKTLVKSSSNRRNAILYKLGDVVNSGSFIKAQLKALEKFFSMTRCKTADTKPLSSSGFKLVNTVSNELKSIAIGPETKLTDPKLYDNIVLNFYQEYKDVYANQPVNNIYKGLNQTKGGTDKEKFLKFFLNWKDYSSKETNVAIIDIIKNILSVETRIILPLAKDYKRAQMAAMAGPRPAGPAGPSASNAQNEREAAAQNIANLAADIFENAKRHAAGVGVPPPNDGQVGVPPPSGGKGKGKGKGTRNKKKKRKGTRTLLRKTSGGDKGDTDEIKIDLDKITAELQKSRAILEGTPPDRAIKALLRDITGSVGIIDKQISGETAEPAKLEVVNGNANTNTVGNESSTDTNVVSNPITEPIASDTGVNPAAAGVDNPVDKPVAAVNPDSSAVTSAPVLDLTEGKPSGEPVDVTAGGDGKSAGIILAEATKLKANSAELLSMIKKSRPGAQGNFGQSYGMGGLPDAGLMAQIRELRERVDSLTAAQRAAEEDENTAAIRAIMNGEDSENLKMKFLLDIPKNMYFKQMGTANMGLENYLKGSASSILAAKSDELYKQASAKYAEYLELKAKHHNDIMTLNSIPPEKLAELEKEITEGGVKIISANKAFQDILEKIKGLEKQSPGAEDKEKKGGQGGGAGDDPAAPVTSTDPTVTDPTATVPEPTAPVPATVPATVPEPTAPVSETPLPDPNAGVPGDAPADAPAPAPGPDAPKAETLEELQARHAKTPIPPAELQALIEKSQNVINTMNTISPPGEDATGNPAAEEADKSRTNAQAKIDWIKTQLTPGNEGPATAQSGETPPADAATTSPDSPTSTDANAPTSPGAAGEAAEVIKEAGVNVATMIKNMDQLIARGTEMDNFAASIEEKTAVKAAEATNNQAATLAAEAAKANAAPVPGPGDTQGAPKAEGGPEKPPGDATPAPPGPPADAPPADAPPAEGEVPKPPAEGEVPKPPEKKEETPPAKEEKPAAPEEKKPAGGSKSRKGKKSKKSKKGKKAKKNTRKKSKKSNKRA